MRPKKQRMEFATHEDLEALAYAPELSKASREMLQELLQHTVRLEQDEAGETGEDEQA